MLSKVLAGLVASMAVAFAGYSMVHDSSKSHCCSGSMVTPSISTESECCQEPAPSCCESSTAAAATCPACPAMKAAATVATDKTTTGEDK